MRNVLVGLVSTLALASAMATNGCGGSSGGGGGTSSGGASGSGGGSGGSTQANCPAGQTCGGDLKGTWTVSSSCLTLSGNMDGFALYLGCQNVPVTGSLKVTGTWTANSDGTYADNTTTTGSMTFALSSSCLTVSSTPVACSKISGVFTAAGWDTATCSSDSSGQCSCSLAANQKGGIGVIYPNASDSGAYTTSSGSGVLKVDEEMNYSYCVSGDSLTLTPKYEVLPVTGTIVLQKASTPGSGGAGGGTTASGGNTGAGGSTTGAGGSTTGSGGTTAGTGGTATSKGGATGSGGATGGGTTGAGGSSGTGGTSSVGGASGKGPCDIYAAASNKCVAAHSTVRALFGSYSGPLYQVKRASDSTTKDIPVLSPGGVADSSVQDAFCTGTTCVITKVYDQSGNGNFVEAETTDSEDATVRSKSSSQTVASATKEQLTVGGHKVYSLWMGTGQAYWRDGSKSGMPLGKSPQGVYMVTSGTHKNIGGCCFDYGNGETSRTVGSCGSMDSVNFSTNSQFGSQGAGSGPWVMADFECGLKAQGQGGTNNNDLSMTQPYVTAIEKNDGTSEFELMGADATTGNLTSFFKGKLPFTMQKEGSIVLGSGGDCCYSNSTLSSGTFYEGAIVAGYPSDATDNAVQANIVSAGYGK